MSCGFCVVCGLHVVRGHTKWAKLLCDYCFPRVRRLNDVHGRLLIPVGIHSMMNGVGQPLNPAPAPALTLAQAVAFADQFNAVLDAISAASSYGKEVLRRRCERLDLTGEGDVDVDRYLAAAREAGETPAQAWEEFETLLYESTAAQADTAEGQD